MVQTLVASQLANAVWRPAIILLLSMLGFGRLAALRAEDVSFHRQIVPLLTRAGCNSGACHGAAAGRGGLHLSLFGSRAEEDHPALTLAFEGRRLNRWALDKSLLLLKPLGELDHGGGQLWDSDSREHQLLRSWLQQGAKLDPPVSLHNFQVDIRPVEGKDFEFSLQATAQISSGSEVHDVTGLTQFTVVDAEAVKLNLEAATACLLRPGRHLVLARYRNRVQPVLLTRPYAGSQSPEEHSVRTDNSRNFIDQAINTSLLEMHLDTGDGVNDAQFLRRATLDLTGRLPEPEAVLQLTASPAPDRRERAVDRLLASPALTDYWTLKFAGWLHLHSLPNETAGTTAYAQWIRQSVSDGTSWREMARQLLMSTGDSHAIGPANFARMVGDARSHAELISEVFLGARLGCANCHDHPLDQWTQDDYHGLAAMLARIERGRHVRFTARGEVTHPQTLQPARWRIPGERYIDPAAEAVTEPMALLTEWLTDPQQDRLSLVFSNRVWAEMFGRGLVDPVDDLRVTNPSTHPELLLQLARQTAARDFDMRALLRWIVTSDAYARRSRQQPDPLYASHQSRALSPHVLADAIADVTGVPMQFEGQPLGTRAVHCLDPLKPAAALDSLGRCNRASACVNAAQASGLALGLHLLNGELINRTLTDPDSRLMRMIKANKTTAEIVSEFHLLAFSQPPTDLQLAYWVNQLDSTDEQKRSERLQDWLWSVLVSERFQHNH